MFKQTSDIFNIWQHFQHLEKIQHLANFSKLGNIFKSWQNFRNLAQFPQFGKCFNICQILNCCQFLKLWDAWIRPASSRINLINILSKFINIWLTWINIEHIWSTLIKLLLKSKRKYRTSNSKINSSQAWIEFRTNSNCFID